MKQQIITSAFRNEFQKTVQQYLDMGWKVIPGTLAISLHDLDMGATQERYVVFLEKPLDK